MIVLDASAAISGLLNDAGARHTMTAEQLHAPHLVDSEVASGLRRLALSRAVDEDDAWRALNSWRQLAVTRYAVHGLLDRIWELRSNFSAYDAGYVALAEALDCALVTADARLSRGSGIRCPVTVVPG